MTMVLPQTSREGAMTVATALRKEGFSVLVREDDKYGWVVEVIGKHPEGSE